MIPSDYKFFLCVSISIVCKQFSDCKLGIPWSDGWFSDQFEAKIYCWAFFCGFSQKTALVSGVYSPITKEYWVL
jgi:hypothetical protein